MSADKRELKTSYIARDKDLMALVDWQWPMADIATVIASRRQHPVDRQTLVAELIRQNQALPAAELVMDNIHALTQETTFTIATGHQVCLLGGPMFTLYKIASAIGMARQLARQYPAHRFVPVLWMATEDHDWEEVNHFFPAFGEKRVYAGQFEGPVGRHVLEASILDILPADLPQAIRAIYQPGRSMAEAFRLLMHTLFGQFGLVILDPDRAVLKQAFTDTMLRELQGNGVATAVRATTATLETQGFKAQIYPREVNLFYIGDGKRRLIDRNATGFQLKDGDRQWDNGALVTEMAQFPAHFSPNVALRPLYQETLLPNLAYIGGWAEVAYWLQLRDAFRGAGIFYPIVVPRLHATLVTTAQKAEWEALGLQVNEIGQPNHVLNDRYLDLHWDEAPLTDAIAAVDAAFAQLTGLVEGLDPTLATGIKAEQARSDNAFDALRKKLRKSLRNRNPQPYQAIANLKNAIEPENTPQQRTLNFTTFNAIDPVILAQILVDHAAWEQSQTQWITLP
jgi:bacillithiol biosynthesis cysteine-adding enzyme BshC